MRRSRADVNAGGGRVRERGLEGMTAEKGLDSS